MRGLNSQNEEAEAKLFEFKLSVEEMQTLVKGQNIKLGTMH